MNPNNPNNLDPKLRQAYESIMSGTSQTPTQQPTPQQPAQPPQNEPMQQPAQPPQPPVEQPAPKMQTEVISEQPTPMNFTPPPPEEDVLQSPLYKGTGNLVNPNPSAQDAQEAINPKKKGKYLPIFISLGIIVFFIIYALVWSKVFGLF